MYILFKVSYINFLVHASMQALNYAKNVHHYFQMKSALYSTLATKLPYASKPANINFNLDNVVKYFFVTSIT